MEVSSYVGFSKNRSSSFMFVMTALLVKKILYTAHSPYGFLDYGVSYLFFEEVSIRPLFLIVQQVHTHPMITAIRTMMNTPISDPRAIVGACCVVCACVGFQFKVIMCMCLLLIIRSLVTLAVAVVYLLFLLDYSVHQIDKLLLLLLPDLMGHH